jgi:TRAP-type mannitol/chloroaromatic compound transport system permease small subunit
MPGRRKSDVDTLLAISRVIDAVNTRIGRWFSWLILITVLVSAGNATIRKVFNASSNSWLELQWVLFSVVFLLCSPWTLLSNEHIRIDIVNNLLPKRVRNAIDLLGHGLFLLPLCIVMIITSYPFFVASLRINEQSPNAGGLPQWPAKALPLIGFTLLFAQAISELIKRIAIMRGKLADTPSGGGHHAAAEEEAKRLLAELTTESH